MPREANSKLILGLIYNLPISPTMDDWFRKILNDKGILPKMAWEQVNGMKEVLTCWLGRDQQDDTKARLECLRILHKTCDETIEGLHKQRRKEQKK